MPGLRWQYALACRLAGTLALLVGLVPSALRAQYDVPPDATSGGATIGGPAFPRSTPPEAIPPGATSPADRYDRPLAPPEGELPENRAPVDSVPPGMEGIPPGITAPPNGRSTPPPDGSAQIVDVRLVGNRRVSPEKFTRMVRTRSGRVFERRVIEDDVRGLLKSGEFLDVRAFYEQPSPETIVVVFQVVERPRIEFIRYIGAEKIKPKKLAKETELKTGGPFDPQTVYEAKQKIEALYRKKGFNQARVECVKGLDLNDRGVEFIIHEGPLQKVWHVTFVGNTIATDARLRTQIQSKPPILFIFKGQVDEEKIGSDIDRLTSYYRSLGFFQAKVAREVEFNEKQNWAKITFVINEGPRYVVRSVSFVGNRQFASDQWTRRLEMKAGKFFDQGELNADKSLVQDFYGGRGYVFADIQAEPRFLEEPGTLDMVYTIDEGERYRVGRVDVRINGDHPHTKATVVLNRLDLRPGDIVDTRKIRDAERRMMSSSVFQNDPSKGNVPRIVLIPPDQEGGRMASPPRSRRNVRGQSPEEPADRYVDVGLEGLPFIPAGGTQPAPAAHAAPPATSSPTRPAPRPAAPRPAPVVRGQDPGPTSDRPAAGTRQLFPPRAKPRYHPVYGTQPPARTAAAPAPAKKEEPIFRAQFQPGGGGRAPGDPNPEPIYNVAPSVNPSADPVYEPLPPNGGAAPDDGAIIQPMPPTDQPIFDPPSDPRVIINPVADETQTGRLMFGVGVNSNAGVVGSIVLEEQNFDWKRIPTSWQDIANATAFRGAGQRLRIEAVPGTQVQRYAVSFTEPYLLDTPVSLSLSGFFFTRFYNEWSEQRLGGRTGLGYQLTPDLSATVAFRAEEIKIFNPINPTPALLTQALGSNNLYSVRVGLAHDTRDSAFLPTEGHYIEAGFEQAFGSFVYPTGSLEGRQYFMLHQRPDRSGRHVLGVSGSFGLAGPDIPIYERYFVGGFTTIRGFSFRGASPRDANGVVIGGRFQALGSIEYMFPLTADDALRGVVFTDFGAVDQSLKITKDNIRVAPGFGLRITVPGMGPAPIALDFAFPVVKQARDQEQIFSFFIGVLR